MITGALSAAASSLKAQQQAIDVISHNIANVNTPGYSRQTATLSTAAPDSQGAFHFGRGVNLTDIQRAVDPFLSRALDTNSNQLAYSQTLEQGLNSVESVFGSLDAPGLASSLDDFFQSYQSLANNPQDTAQRNNVRGRALDITTHLHTMRGQLVSAQNNTDNSIDSAITKTNQLLDQLASLNTQISARENTTGNPANDLRDQRDMAVRKLSTLIPIQTISGNGTAFMIQSKGGDLLAQDGDVRHLARGASSGSGFTSVVLSGSSVKVAGIDSGGEIGGLLTLRDNRLGVYISQLDSLASNLSFGLNQLHANGSGLNPSSTLSSEMSASAPADALDAAGQNIPFASQIVSGSFKLHVYDAAGAPLIAGGTSISITQGSTTVNQLVSQLNAVGGISASLDAGNHIVLDAGSGSLALSSDTSNVLAAYEIGTFFHGDNAANIALSTAVTADSNRIAAGSVDATTSINNPGGNDVALQIIDFQNTALTVDGSNSASVLERSTALAMDYAGHVQSSNQQRVFRDAEAQSLNAQRQAMAGVSTDDELVHMIEFQRAYEASAKVIQTSNTMLDSLMSLIR